MNIGQLKLPLIQEVEIFSDLVHLEFKWGILFQAECHKPKNNCSVVTIPGIVKTIACCLSIKQSNCCCTDVSEVFHFTIAQMGWKYLCYLLSLYIFPMGCFLIYLWWVYKWWVEVVVVYGLLITNVFSAMILQCGSYFLLLTCTFYVYLCAYKILHRFRIAIQFMIFLKEVASPCMFFWLV